MSQIEMAPTVEPPYYAVIFTSLRTEEDKGYGATAQKMVEMVSKQPGFLGMETARENGLGITVSYWKDLASISAWKSVSDHEAAQRGGAKTWYENYQVRIARVERQYGKPQGV